MRIIIARVKFLAEGNNNNTRVATPRSNLEYQYSKNKRAVLTHTQFYHITHALTTWLCCLTYTYFTAYLEIFMPVPIPHETHHSTHGHAGDNK